MTLEELKKELKKKQERYPFVVLILEDIEKNLKNYQKYLKMKFPIAKILADN